MEAVKSFKPRQDVGMEIIDVIFCLHFDTVMPCLWLLLCHVIKTIDLMLQHSSLSSTNYTQTCWDRQQRRREREAERYYKKSYLIKVVLILSLWFPTHNLLRLPLQMFIRLIHLPGTFTASLWQFEAVKAMSNVVWPQTLQQTNHLWLQGKRGC